MTELETVQRAKMYLDKLANGIDPLTDRPVPDTDCINQVRISRCLFYVSDVLRQVIENGGKVGGREKRTRNERKPPFEISSEALAGFRFSHTPLKVSEIADRLNELIDAAVMTRLKSASINVFLLQNGFLTELALPNGKTAKIPNEHGKSIGITYEERITPNGSYSIALYGEEAQRFILDHLPAIIAIDNRASASSESRADSYEN